MHPNDTTTHIPHNVGTHPTPDTRHHGAKQAGAAGIGDATDRAGARIKGPTAGGPTMVDEALLPHAAGLSSAISTLLKNNFAARYSTPMSEAFINWMWTQGWAYSSDGMRPVWLTATPAPQKDTVWITPHEDAFEAVARVVQAGELLLDPTLPDGPERTQMLGWLTEGWRPAEPIDADAVRATSGEENTITRAPSEPSNLELFNFYEHHKDLRNTVIGEGVTGQSATLEQMEALNADYRQRVADGRIVDGMRIGCSRISDGDWEARSPLWANWLWQHEGSPEPAYLLQYRSGNTGGVESFILQDDALERIATAPADQHVWPLNPGADLDRAIAAPQGYTPDNESLALSLPSA